MKSYLLDKKIVILSNISLALLWGFFLWRHLVYFWNHGGWFILLFVIIESVLILILLFRKRPIDISTKITDWAVAFLGTFMPFLFVPSGNTYLGTLGEMLLFVGAAIILSAYLSLNTSFGIVPGNRGIKTSGVYSIVRHPMYTGYILLNVGYLMLSMSLYNLFILTIIISTILYRVHAEEIFLETTNTGYTEFKKRIRFALFPFLF